MQLIQPRHAMRTVIDHARRGTLQPGPCLAADYTIVRNRRLWAWPERLASAACRALNLLLAGGDVQSAALLTPYNGQVRQLRTELDSRNFLFRGNSSLELVVSTIDGFQVTSWAEVLLFSGSW